MNLKQAEQILGINSTDEPEKITKAFHKLAYQYHPDRHGNKYSEKMSQINEAYSVVRNYQEENKKRFENSGDFKGFKKVNTQKTQPKKEKPTRIFDTGKGILEKIVEIAPQNIKKANSMYAEEIQKASKTMESKFKKFFSGLQKDIFVNKADNVTVSDILMQNAKKFVSEIKKPMTKKKNQEVALGWLATVFGRDIIIDNNKKSETEKKKQKNMFTNAKCNADDFLKLKNTAQASIELHIETGKDTYMKKLLDLTLIQCFDDHDIMLCKDKHKMYRVTKL